MKGRRIDTLALAPPTVQPGDYGYSGPDRIGHRAFWVRPPLAGVPSQLVVRDRIRAHWHWGVLKSDLVSVRGILVWFRGLGAERRIVWAGYLERGTWRQETDPDTLRRITG